MRPSDGFWGVAERLAITAGNEAADRMLSAFPCVTCLTPELVVMEARRADCTFEVAYLFDLAADALEKAALKTVADNLIAFMRARSHLRQADPKHPDAGLWGWAMPIAIQKYWTDDNAWVITLLLKLSARGRPELRPLAIEAARCLNRHVGTYFDRLAAHGREMPRAVYGDIPVFGLNLNPHWIGLVCMALAHASAADPETPYRRVIDAYYDVVLQGPPPCDAAYAPPSGTGRAWTLSEYAYLGLSAAIVARQFPQSRAPEIAAVAGRELLRAQFKDGHFAAEHAEAPAAPHLADLIYTDNWAALAFHHLHVLTGETAYRKARDRSLRFLASVQDRSGSPFFAGCWRGMYDTTRGCWGGGDRYEGGASSIYSGWTNAPIAWAFLFAAGCGDLFPAALPESNRNGELP